MKERVFFALLVLVVAHVLGDAWLSVRCVEAHGIYDRGFYFDTCRGVGK